MGNLDRYTLKDLQYWSERIEKEAAPSLGIDFYPQEFELVNYKTMLERKTYLGIPYFFPNWASGKRYEVSSTLFSHRLEYLPYELIIASVPSQAYLSVENDLAMQLLTMTHCYGHNNFFKHNTYFRKYFRPELTIDFFANLAERFRSYEQNPSIGRVAVMRCVEAAQALVYNCAEVLQPHLPDPEQARDLLIFLRDNSPRQPAEWERDIMTGIQQAFNHLTKAHTLTIGANEGWAVYCHYKLMKALNLPDDLSFGFARHHSKVVRLPDNPLSYNHYLVNSSIWNSLEKRFGPEESVNSSPVKPISHKLFEIVASTNDVDFVNNYLDAETAQELNLFLWLVNDRGVMADRTMNDPSSPERRRINLMKIKEMITGRLGFSPIPVIAVTDPNYEGDGSLYLKHIFNGRNLEPEYTLKTLEHVHYFWGRPVLLETRTRRRQLPYIYNYNGMVGIHHIRR